MVVGEGPRLRLDFWQAFKQFMLEDTIVACGRASSETWMHHDAGLNFGRLFSIVRVRTGEVGSQWAADDASARTVYSFLSAHRSEIDVRFGQGVTWRVVNERQHELEVRRSVDLARREEWPSLFRWLSGNLHVFRMSLGEYVGHSTPSSHRGNWDAASFFGELAKNSSRGVEPARRMLEWGKQSMPHIYWGHGQSEGSFVPVLLRQGIEHSVVSVHTTGVLCVRFGALKKTPPFDDEQLRHELLGRLNAAPHIDLPPTVVERYPSLPLPLLDEPGVLAAVLDTMDWIVSLVKGR